MSYSVTSNVLLLIRICNEILHHELEAIFFLIIKFWEKSLLQTLFSFTVGSTHTHPF
jgi:hypothetical protein